MDERHRDGRAIAEFTAHGSVRAVSAAIEACAAERRVVSALVVPWESDASTLRMSVTSTTGDPRAAEHTNLGTITLDSLGDVTRVAVVAHEPEPSGADDGDPDAQDKRAGVLAAFARQVERKLASTVLTERPQ
jgi:hypothetical protein